MVRARRMHISTRSNAPPAHRTGTPAAHAHTLTRCALAAHPAGGNTQLAQTTSAGASARVAACAPVKRVSDISLSLLPGQKEIVSSKTYATKMVAAPYGFLIQGARRRCLTAARCRFATALQKACANCAPATTRSPPHARRPLPPRRAVIKAGGSFNAVQPACSFVLRRQPNKSTGFSFATCAQCYTCLDALKFKCGVDALVLRTAAAGSGVYTTSAWSPPAPISLTCAAPAGVDCFKP
jgi:hypothetical protein